MNTNLLNPSLPLAIQPKKFDSKNLDTPKIKTIPNSVSLLCTVELLNNIEQEGKVEYLIEWFADGNVLQFNTPKCDKQNNSPCPSPDKSISSKLQGKDYTAGKWVREMLFIEVPGEVLEGSLKTFQ